MSLKLKVEWTLLLLLQKNTFNVKYLENGDTELS